MKLIKYFIIVLSFILFGPVSNAQEVSFAVSPSVQHIMVKPGYIVKLATNFTNLGDPTTTLISIQPLKINQTTGKLEINTINKEESGPISIQSSLPVNTPFSIKNKESRQTTLTVSIAPDTEEKDYYYTVLIKSQPTPSTEGTASIKLQNNLGSLLIITVSKNGQTNSDISIPLFAIIPHHRLNFFGRILNIFNTSDLIPLNLIIGNTGNNFTRVQGKIEITNKFGYYHQVAINDYLVTADSQTSVQLASPICKDISDECRKDSTYTFQPKHIGTYTAQVAIVDKSTGKSILANTEFVVLPIKTLLTIFYGVVLVCVFYYISKRHKKKK